MIYHYPPSISHCHQPFATPSCRTSFFRITSSGATFLFRKSYRSISLNLSSILLSFAALRGECMDPPITTLTYLQPVSDALLPPAALSYAGTRCPIAAVRDGYISLCLLDRDPQRKGKERKYGKRASDRSWIKSN